MTVMTEHRTAPDGDRNSEYAQMTPDEFEQLAAGAPETVTLEFIGGRIGVKAVPDGDHDEMIRWLAERCMQHQPGLWLYPERGLVVSAYRKGRAKPDGVLAPKGQFKGQGTWADPEGVLLVVEVTSADADTNQRDRLDKPSGYAAAGIPVYLLVDREQQTLVVHSEPDREAGRYRDTHTAAFGEDVPLPDPVDLTLDTTVLKTGEF